jgi:hypothetical protein
MNRSVVIIIGWLSAAALAAVIAVVGIGFWLLRELPAPDADLSLPLEAELNSTISMVVTVSNPHDEVVTLDSIDIDESFLEGFQIISIDPKPTDTNNVPFIGQRSWSFGKQLPPGESLAVAFEMKPIAEGRFSGDVDVCNPNQDFTTLYAEVTVTKQLTDEPLEEMPQ